MPALPIGDLRGNEIGRRSRRHDGGDRMLVDELRRPIPPQQQREGVEPGDHALQLHAFDEENRHRHLGAANAVQELILQTQCARADMPILASASRLSPIPSAFSFRCKAERSMPMNDAVREMLPEKRLIWILQIFALEGFARFPQRAAHDGHGGREPPMALWLSRISGGRRSTSMQDQRDRRAPG